MSERGNSYSRKMPKRKSRESNLEDKTKQIQEIIAVTQDSVASTGNSVGGSRRKCCFIYILCSD